MNKVFLIGNLTKEPEIRSTPAGKKLASFSLAINDGKNPTTGQDIVQYFNCTAWEQKADVIEKYVKKGHKVCVTGKLQNRSWDKPDGTKAYATDILVTELEMLTSKNDADRINAMPQTDNASSPSKPSVAKEDDLPEIDVNSINVNMPF